jgi:hypothetical protein
MFKLENGKLRYVHTLTALLQNRTMPGAGGAGAGGPPGAPRAGGAGPGAAPGAGAPRGAGPGAPAGGGR